MLHHIATVVDDLATGRAQSESLGSLLLVAVVVISVATFGAYYLASATSGGGIGGSVEVAVDASATTDTLTISHNGGDSVSTADLRVVVENESGEYTYAVSDGTILDGGGADGQFDAGETWELPWNQSAGSDVKVSLIDADSEALLFRETITVSTTATDRPSNRVQGREIESSSGNEETEETIFGAYPTRIDGRVFDYDKRRTDSSTKPYDGPRNPVV